ncbi:threonine--tRNA ligase [Bacteriovorax stolpii]|uniref:Threonine--tRNA ligase n=1 Tax=Bacteriovorax stolpii TaxID=960 RepID=A0A2K9NPM4_BACTC|nr:threonine--tRNA ligase [Bacteriovorax stolpii]AUN97459.1 threonine--tRNA ligase [Bacteriovorax stolpii]TDP52636.1 threonyl-tRNA synthetase [Bacteriovorax stolpii]
MSYLFDHRKLAVEMELYFFEEAVGAGLPMWLPNGCIIKEELEKFIKRKEFLAGYERVSSPHMAKAELYEKSGHLRFYKEDMFPAIKMENLEYYLRPMNCPHHHKMFSCKPRSYRELPLRLAEYGQVYRHEASGSLRGISRVRGLCQNDAHIYVSAEHSKDEIIRVLRLHEECYKELGLEGYRYRLSKHDPNSKDFLGEREVWVQAEDILRSALLELKLDYFEAIGEAAFYGPKIDVQMKFFSDEGIREESMGSVQLDFISAQKERFDLEYIDKEGKMKRPWIIHRAPLGSHERFIAMLLEYFDGRLPRFLSPIELFIFPLSEEAALKANDIASELMEKGVRVKIDHRLGSSLSKRIVLASKLRPFSSMVIGEKELSGAPLRVEARDGKVISLMEFSSLI